MSTYTVTLTHPTGSTVTASAVTRQDARDWARRFRAIDDVVTITRGEAVAPVRWWGVWSGGAGNYTQGDASNPADVDRHATIADAVALFERRYRNAGGSTPCVGEDAETWLYAWDPTQSVDPYPARIIRLGARGGIRVERA